MSDFLNEIEDRIKNGTATPVEVMADLMTRYDDRGYEWDEPSLLGAAEHNLEELRKRGYDIVRLNAGEAT